MFKSLINFWSGRQFVTRVLEDFGKMLSISEEMYQRTVSEFLDPKDDPQSRQKIYDLDQEINRLEKGIRRRIVEHLAVRPAVENNVCLILMSVVKDAERVGDYIKNLLELAILLDRPLDDALFHKYFGDLLDRLAENFSRASRAFIQSHEELAKETIQDKHQINTRCDEILEEVVKSDLSANNAACFAVLARTLKRISSHLTNISSAVIMPITDLDYYDEKHLEEH